MIGDLQQVVLDDGFWDDDVLGVSSIQDDEVVTEVLTVGLAIVALLTGSCIAGSHSHPRLELGHPFSHDDNASAELMPKSRWDTLDDLGMASLIGLDVRATGQGGLYFDQNLARARSWDLDPLEPYISRSVEKCRIH
jgi:hypothetical protein